jgi:hypothetical protein
LDRRLLGFAVGLALVGQLAAAVGAPADGLGTLGITSTEGATSPVSGERLVAIPTGRGPTKGTTVERLQQDGGALIDSRYLEQRLSLPGVAFDGTAGGLSADGETAVLVPPVRGFHPRRSTFVVLDARRLDIRDQVTLPGTYTFDALSPDGSQMYLIEYPSPNASREYRVRSYDLRSDHLLPHPIVDPDEPPGEMQGFPMTRTTSPDGRWAYTLYDGDKHPFIHALDTDRGRAVCIDLDRLKTNTAYEARLTSNPDGSELTVSDRKRDPVAVVDTATFEVSDPAEPAEDGAGFPWLGLVLVPVALGGAWALARGLRRRRIAPGGAR